MTPLQFDLDDLVTKYVETTTEIDFAKYDCGCKYCENGVVESVDWIDYGSTTVPLRQSEPCECVWDSDKLKIKVYVKWLKEQVQDHLVLPELFT